MAAPAKTSTHIRTNTLINEIQNIQKELHNDQNQYEMHKKDGNEELQKYFLAQYTAKKYVIDRLTHSLKINLPEDQHTAI